MFPSSDNNQFPHFPHHHHLYISSSSFGQSNFINETLFHHHQQHHQTSILNQAFDDGIQEDGVHSSNLCDAHTNTKVEFLSENMNVYGDDNNYQYAPLDIIPARCQPPGKKDRHSKIVTAQGPRDRRVRLSIDIAKKFFGLQDMLGFDKASKTLDWLLTKSKIAIEEVAHQSKMKNSHIEKDQEMMINDVLGKGKRSAKEYNRVKARERARERTRRKKLCILGDHKLSDQSLISPSTSNSNQSLPLMSKMGDCKISDVDFDMNCNVYSNLFPQVSSPCKELMDRIKKTTFVSSSSMYNFPSNNSCPEDHFFP